MIDYNEDSIDVEQGFLGGLLKLSDPSGELFTKAIGMVKENSFYLTTHRLIFRAIKKAVANNFLVDLITVTDLLEKSNEIDSVGGFVYVAELMNKTASSENIIAYAKLTRNYAVERYAKNKMQELIGMFSDRSNGDIYQRLGLINTTLTEISNRGLNNDSGGLKHITDSLGTWLDNIDQVLKDGFDKNAFTTGIESLDFVLGIKGLRRGSLVGVGARPKMGKSAFMMLIANHFALDLKEAVAIFSMEMPSVEIAERAMSCRTTVNPAEFYRNGISSESSGRRDTAFNELMNSNMFVDDGAALTLSHIQRESRRIRKEKGSIGLICVDYLTLMEAEKADRNDLAYGMITKALKNLAKELNCVVLMLTQLNRGLENRQDKRPMPSDSRDTGQIEQDVDLWIGLYKESVYDETLSNEGLTELLVRLNRHGGTGTGFVEMKQGFHVPLSIEAGAKILNDREQTKLKANPEPQEFKKKANNK